MPAVASSRPPSDRVWVTERDRYMSEPRNFLKLLHARRAAGKRVCIGLDPDIDKMNIPEGVPDDTILEMQLRLCMSVVDETKDIALAFKPNIAFFARKGGYRKLMELIRYINRVAPDVPVIVDFKRGDIGNTNKGYVGEAFDIFLADAITVHPYLGQEAMAPFLADPNKFVFVLCKTSNPGSGEFQDLLMRVPEQEVDDCGFTECALYEYVAYRVATRWNGNGNVGLVVGATYPEQLEQVRDIVGFDMELLVPGIGTQGGDANLTIQAGGNAIVVNASSSIMFSSNIRQSALELETELLAAEASLV